MPRVLKADLAKQQQAQASQQLEKALVLKGKPRFAPRKTVAAEVKTMVAGGKWERMRPTHFVELYCLGHLQVYGVEAAELTGSGKAAVNARKGAASAAARMLRQEFGDKPIDMVRYFDWTWKREVGREQWAKENQRERGRLTWQTMIAGRAILTDYRAAKLRLVPTARATNSRG